MKYFEKGFLLLAIAVGLMVGLTALPAMAVNITDTHTATDLDSAVRNGIAVSEGDTQDYEGGQLFVGYYKTNGTRTSANAQGTQDTVVEMDTVQGVPTAEMVIQLATDADSVNRELYVEGFVGFRNYSGETLPHRAYEAGETVPMDDSAVLLQIETFDTATVRIHLFNTSNYACTMFVSVHLPDTDLNFGWRGNSYIEETNTQLAKFVASIYSDSTSRAPTAFGMTQALSPVDTNVPQIGSVRLAEDAETNFFLRVGSSTGATARDSLSITVVSWPDSGPEYTQRYSRIWSDSGYYGDNDTQYGQGGSSDSVSIFVYVATAVVRVKKTDTVWAPKSYQRSLNFATGRANDTVPGATIVYEISYDNDGNRRADSIQIIDFLDPNVDLLVDSFFTGYDTVFPYGIGVDTSRVHSRWMANIDTGAIVDFSDRTGDSTIFFGQTTPFISTSSDSVVETVAAIRVRWPGAREFSLKRDQVDEGTFGGSVLDRLDSVNGLDITTANTASNDSGDCGRIYFAVVIR